MDFHEDFFYTFYAYITRSHAAILCSYASLSTHRDLNHLVLSEKA